MTAFVSLKFDLQSQNQSMFAFTGTEMLLLGHWIAISSVVVTKMPKSETIAIHNQSFA
jgi:hypothetical protein